MKKRYIIPEAEMINLNINGDIMEGFPIPISGNSRPEDAETHKFDPYEAWEDKNDELYN